MITILEKFLTGLEMGMEGGGGRVKAITRTASAVKNHTMLDFLDRYYLSQHISVR
jgi:hypothetical protein